MSLILKNVSKAFVGKQAVDNISFRFRKTRSIWASWNKWSRKNYNNKNVAWNYQKRQWGNYLER